MGYSRIWNLIPTEDINPLNFLLSRHCVAAQLAFPLWKTASSPCPVTTSSSQGRWNDSEGKACRSPRTRRSAVTSSWSFLSIFLTGSLHSPERLSDNTSPSHRRTLHHQHTPHTTTDYSKWPRARKSTLTTFMSHIFTLIVVFPLTLPVSHVLMQAALNRRCSMGTFVVCWERCSERMREKFHNNGQYQVGITSFVFWPKKKQKHLSSGAVPRTDSAQPWLLSDPLFITLFFTDLSVVFICCSNV